MAAPLARRALFPQSAHLNDCTLDDKPVRPPELEDGAPSRLFLEDLGTEGLQVPPVACPRIVMDEGQEALLRRCHV